MSRSEIIPRTASSRATTRAPTFFARNQSAALLTLASGPIVVTSVPFCIRMFSTFIAVSLCGRLGGAGTIILRPTVECSLGRHIGGRGPRSRETSPKNGATGGRVGPVCWTIDSTSPHHFCSISCADCAVRDCRTLGRANYLVSIGVRRRRVRCNKISTSTSEVGQTLHFSDVGVMSALHPIVLQNDFERWSEEYFSEIARQCGILIQESVHSDSNLAHYFRSAASRRLLQHNPPDRDQIVGLSARRFRAATFEPSRAKPPAPLDQSRPMSAKTLSSCFSTSGDAATKGRRCSLVFRTPRRLSIYLTGIGLLSNATPRNSG